MLAHDLGSQCTTPFKLARLFGITKLLLGIVRMALEPYTRCTYTPGPRHTRSSRCVPKMRQSRSPVVALKRRNWKTHLHTVNISTPLIKWRRFVDFCTRCASSQENDDTSPGLSQPCERMSCHRSVSARRHVQGLQ